MQQLTCPWKARLAAAVGQQTIVPDTVEPAGQHRQQEAAHELLGRQRHGPVQVEAHDRKRLEQLCRYITRPALSDERVQLNAAGQVELKLKSKRPATPS
jgi:hypothetical protein